MSSLRVGFIGVGSMGMAMAKPVVRKGFPLAVYDINEKAVAEIQALGAQAAASPAEVARASDIVFTMVRNIEQTDEVIFGKHGIWDAITGGKTIIVASSIGPDYCRELYNRAKDRGVRVIDCAVSDPSGFLHTVEGGLTLMIGGDKDHVGECWPVFEAMATHPFYLGEIGTGQTYKLINNLATFNIGALNREILNLGLAAGLDLEKMIDVMSVSTGGSWSLWFNGQMLKHRRENPDAGPRPAGPPPPPRQPGAKRPLPLEKKLAMELAEKLDVGMPIGDFIDSLDTEGLYEHYAARIRQ